MVVSAGILCLLLAACQGAGPSRNESVSNEVATDSPSLTACLAGARTVELTASVERAEDELLLVRRIEISAEPALVGDEMIPVAPAENYFAYRPDQPENKIPLGDELMLLLSEPLETQGYLPFQPSMGEVAMNEPIMAGAPPYDLPGRSISYLVAAQVSGQARVTCADGEQTFAFHGWVDAVSETLTCEVDAEPQEAIIAQALAHC